MAPRKQATQKVDPTTRKRKKPPPPKRKEKPPPSANRGPQNPNGTHRPRNPQKRNKPAVINGIPTGPASYRVQKRTTAAPKGGVHRAIFLDKADIDDGEINSDDDGMFEIDQVIGGTENVMYPMLEALSIYQRLVDLDFPLRWFGDRTRYDEVITEDRPIAAEPVQEAGAVTFSQYRSVFFKADTMAAAGSETFHLAPLMSGSPSPSPSNDVFEPVQKTRRSSASSTEDFISLDVVEPESDAAIQAKSYVFDFGAHKGKKFTEVPEYYLRTIASQTHLFNGRHPGLREAFDHFRPGLRSDETSKQQKGNPNRPQSQPNRQPNIDNNSFLLDLAFENYTFPKGAHKGKRMDEVPKSYLATIENKRHVMEKWPGLKDAFRYYNRKMGRKGRI